jgi:polyisoprenyl-phosphate glycosyltransferase
LRSEPCSSPGLAPRSPIPEIRRTEPPLVLQTARTETLFRCELPLTGMSNTTTDYLSVVVPAYNEEECLDECHRRLTTVLASLDLDYELLFVNDGSRDGTLQVIRRLQQQDPHVSLLDLSRNFGKEIALSAGLDVADGAAVIVIDADLQDPPELIPTLVAEWRAGSDVVYAQRQERRGESWLKRATAYSFYRVVQSVSRVSVPPDAGDFRLLSRRAILALRRFREQHRYMKGLFAWIGFAQKAIIYQRDPRFAGQTKWNYWKLWNFALEGITSFTTIPLRVATYIGTLTALGAFGYGTVMTVRTLLYGNPVPGYPSLVVIVLFLGGAQLTATGILGEYLGRVFNETKQRPLYFVNDYEPAKRQAVPARVVSENINT